ncbi:MAG: PstS family phosphate ABC transporter substrate-binding protein [Halococcoides sp.]
MASDQTSSVSRRSFLTTVGAGGLVAVAGCTSTSDGTTGSTQTTTSDSNGQGSLSGEFLVTGSSTVFPLASALAREFQSNHSNVRINVKSTGSGGGFNNFFCKGDSAMNNASRPITKNEKQLCQKNDVEWHEIKVATDALTVIVNPENDWIDCVTFDELKKIWKQDPVTQWSDLDSSYPDEKIKRFGAADTSGTFDYFKETVLGEETNHTTNYQATEKDNLILQGVKQNKNAIGYFGFAYYSGNKDSVKALKIDGGDGCIAPSLETAKSGTYPLSRPLFTYPKMEALKRDEVAEFARFFTKQSANEKLVADRIGYVPNSESEMQTQLQQLNDAIASVQ